MRKAIAAAVAILLILVLTLAAVPRLVNVAGFAARLSTILEETTGRTVRFSRPSLTLFPAVGIRVADLEISGDPSRPGEPLLAAPEADFRLAVIPLLQGRAVFATVVFRRPAIVLRKARDGTTSLTEIASRVAASAVKPTRTAAESEIGQAKIRAGTVVVDEGRVSLRLEDRAGGETRHEIGPFSVRLSGIGTGMVTVDGKTNFEDTIRGSARFHGKLAADPARRNEQAAYRLTLEGDALDQRFSAEGVVSDPFGRTAADLTISFPRIDMGRLPAVVADERRVAAAEPEGIGSVTVKLSGEPDEFGFEAEADLTRAGWAVRPDLRKFIDAPLSIVVQGRRFPDQVIVSNAELKFPPLLLIANASETLSTGAREWKASSRIASLKEFARSRGGLSGWFPSGILTASGNGKREAAARPDEWRVSVDLGEVGFTVPGEGVELRGLNGHVEAGPGSLSFLPLTGLVNGQRFSLRGSIARGAAAVGQVDIGMAYLDLDALLAAREGERAKAERGRDGRGAPGGAGAGRAVSARARVAIEAGKAAGIDFGDFRCNAAYDNGVIRIDSARAELFGGEASFSGRIDPFGPSPEFRVKVAGKGVRAGELLTRKTSLADFLSGEAVFSAEISGRMNTFDDFAKTAAGSGSVRMTNGRIRGIDILRSALLLSGLEGGGVKETEPGGGVPGVTAFGELAADFRLSGGKVRTDSLRIASDRMRLSGKAAIGLDRTLEFTGTLTLPKGAVPRRDGRGRYLPAPSGGIAIPLVMSGALASPAVAIDSQGLASGAVR